mgnify:CR=1 FL=1
MIFFSFNPAIGIRFVISLESRDLQINMVGKERFYDFGKRKKNKHFCPEKNNIWTGETQKKNPTKFHGRFVHILQYVVISSPFSNI